MTRSVIAALAALVIAAGTGAALISPARADDTTVSYDTLRTGWDPNEPGLDAATVTASDYGQLFAAQVDGQVYAQPVVANNVLLVATENDKVYGLDPVTGAVRWTRDVGPSWPASAIGCGDLVPNIGVTGTPVYDRSTDTAYFTAKVNDGNNPGQPHWYLHAVDVATGAERSGFPATIQGSPSNSPGNPFNPYTAMQRPGLLLMDGVVYAGFASHCDHGPYVGYVIGVDAGTGAVTAMWSTQAGSADGGAGIWQAGGGLVSDGAGRIIVTTGNGISPAPGSGDSRPARLAESVVRLGVDPGGTLSTRDFFSPVNNTNLDRDDADLGSGGPLAIPDGYGTAAHPHLLVQVGKDGRVFLLDRDNLGGTGQGPGGSDAVLQTGGPYSGVWGHPAFWGGGSGYVYTVEIRGPLRVFRVGINGNGVPALTAIGTSASAFGYTSGSPVVTSNGTAVGSALVWVVYASGPDGSGGQLRAYDAVPTGAGTLTLRYAAPIGQASKFSVPATSDGRVYVGTREGKVFGFGRPVDAALNAQPTDFGSVAVGDTGHASAHLHANREVTVSAITASAPFGVAAPSLPVTLHAGDDLDVPVTFTPTAPGAQSNALSLSTDVGSFAFDLHGTATSPGISANPTALDFGDVPITGRTALSVNITNTSTGTQTFSRVIAPARPYSATLPAVGSTLEPGASVSVPITFQPRTTGRFTSSLRLSTDTGGVRVPVTGTGVAGAAQLTITPTALHFGTVGAGGSLTKSFDIANTGNLVLTITKAAPPTAPFGTSAPLSEGQQLQPGQVIHQHMTFTPTEPGPTSGTYLITGDDGQGQQTVTFTGRSGNPEVSIPGPATGDWILNGSAAHDGANTVLTDAGADQAGNAVYRNAINPVGVHARFTAELGGGSGADGLAFALLDAAATTPASLGNTGGALGFAGLTGVAVALDTYRNGADPSANFVGIGTAGGDRRARQLDYVATIAATAPLTPGAHSVDVRVTATGIRAVVDDAITVTATVPIPATAYLAFSAGTGRLTDVHTIREVTITRPAPTGRIVGVAGRCATSGPLRAGVRAATLSTCGAGGAQAWTVQGDGTLTIQGRCLSAAGTAELAAVTVVTCDGTAAQVWAARLDGMLRNEASARCLYAPGIADGTELRIRHCGNSAAALWRLPR